MKEFSHKSWVIWIALLFALTSCRTLALNSAGDEDDTDDGSIDTSNISAVADDLELSPTSMTLAVTNQDTFSASGGTSPYTFSIVSGSGSMDASTGEFTAPGSAGVTVIRVTDADGEFVDASVTINAAMSFDSSDIPFVYASTSVDIDVSGGVSPYTYTVQGGGEGSFSGKTYSSTDIGYPTIRVTDSLGNYIERKVAALGSPAFRFMASDMNGNGDGNSGWTDASQVSSWSSSVGSIVATQGTANNRPIYYESDADLGNRPSVQFTSLARNGVANQCLDLSADPQTSASVSIFGVGYTSNALAEAIYYNDATDGYLLFGSTSGKIALSTTGLDGAVLASAAAADTSDSTYVTFGALHIGDTQGGGMGMTNYAVSNSIAGSANNAAKRIPTAGGNNPILGNAGAGCSHNYSLVGRLAEVTYYDGNVAVADALEIDCYLKDLYDISGHDGGC